MVVNEQEIISKIKSLKDEEIQQWIEERIEYLEENAEEDREELSSFSVNARRLNGEQENTEVHGYIPRNTKIKKMMFDMASFKLDDNSIYNTIVDSIRNADENMIYNNNYIMDIVQRTLINYFGIKGIEKKRNDLYNSRSDIDDEPLSISDFKRNGTAMCVERSATAQNILSFLGYDSMLIYGYMSNNKGVVNEGHAYNCIIRNNKAILIDFTNPRCKDGKYYRPASFPVDASHLSDFKRGKAQIEVQHNDYYTTGDKVVEESITCVYASDEIDQKYFQKSIINKLVEETKLEQSDVLTIDDVENITKREMKKQREELTNEKNID